MRPEERSAQRAKVRHRPDSAARRKPSRPLVAVIGGRNPCVADGITDVVGAGWRRRPRPRHEAIVCEPRKRASVGTSELDPGNRPPGSRSIERLGGGELDSSIGGVRALTRGLASAGVGQRIAIAHARQGLRGHLGHSVLTIGDGGVEHRTESGWTRGQCGGQCTIGVVRDDLRGVLRFAERSSERLTRATCA